MYNYADLTPNLTPNPKTSSTAGGSAWWSGTTRHSLSTTKKPSSQNQWSLEKSIRKNSLKWWTEL